MNITKEIILELTFSFVIFIGVIIFIRLQIPPAPLIFLFGCSIPIGVISFFGIREIVGLVKMREENN